MNYSIAFTIIFFAAISIIGWALISLLRFPIANKHYDALLAPGIGIAFLTIATVFLNECGLPVSKFGMALMIGSTALSTVVIFVRRTPMDKHTYGFLPIFLLAFLLSGWPLIARGASWISYANDDMANYAMSAQRFIDQGFDKRPDRDDYIRDSHVSQYFWVFVSINGERYGVDEFLALSAVVARESPLYSFMPCMLVLEISLIAGSAALVWRSAKHLSAARLTALLMACSSLATFGLDSQLIAQSAGLTLLCVTFCLLIEFFSPAVRKIQTLNAVLASIACAGLAEVYPEMLPFLVVPLFAFAFSAIRVSRPYAGSISGSLGLVIAFSAAELNRYLHTITTVLVLRSRSANSGAQFYVTLHNVALPIPFLFPFYLLPTGVANYFGLFPLTVYPRDPWMSIAIITGLVLTIFTLAISIIMTVKREPVAFINAFMLLLFVWLFYKEADFGLYKLAMYSQPFVLGTIAVWATKTWADTSKSNSSVVAQF